MRLPCICPSCTIHRSMTHASGMPSRQFFATGSPTKVASTMLRNGDRDDMIVTILEGDCGIQSSAPFVPRVAEAYDRIRSDWDVGAPRRRRPGKGDGQDRGIRLSKDRTAMSIRRLVLDVDKATSRGPSLIELRRRLNGCRRGLQLHGTGAAARSRARNNQGDLSRWICWTNPRWVTLRLVTS